MGEDTFVMDTPGFSSLFVDMFEEDEIKYYLKNLNPMRDNAGSRDAAIPMNLAVVSNRRLMKGRSVRHAMTTMYSSTMN